MADRVRTAAAAALLLLAVGCTAPNPPNAVTTARAPTPTPTPTPTPAPTPQDAVQRAVDAINATAAGPVAAQQAVLARLVDPADAAAQAACAPATVTVRLDPAMGALAPDGAQGYRLPVLLEVYTGAVRTGTDLAGLRLTVSDGVATIAPLCLR